MRDRCMTLCRESLLATYIRQTLQEALRSALGEDIETINVTRCLNQVKKYKGVRLREEREVPPQPVTKSKSPLTDRCICVIYE